MKQPLKPLLLFLHGWGFDASVWNDLRGHFPPQDTLAWDLGYFGPPSLPALPAGRPVLAIGHSFGLLWLLHRRNPNFSGLVSINGFTCFTQRPDFPAGTPPRLLQRMHARLPADPAAIVTNFRARCGVTTALPAAPITERLSEGLDALQNWDERGAEITAALCGRQDEVATLEMSRACFSQTQILWHEGGHMLPLTAAAWCARQLTVLSDRLS
jgi:pimeloyl-[acyl-carrier protein] methyl ester esterase